MIRENDVSLHSGASVSAACQNVILPWFRKVAPRAWQTEKPAAVLMPSRSHAHFLRALILQEDLPLLGVQFFTPASMRELLGGATCPPLPEHLRLLLAIAAEQDLPPPSVSSAPQPLDTSATTAKAVAREPDHLLRTIHQLGAAGWPCDEVCPPALRSIVRRFAKLMDRCGFPFTHEADRAAAKGTAIAPPIFSDLLVAGFDGAHWPLWFLLRAALNASAQSTVVLSDPHEEARDLDETWIGTWEEIFGAATPIQTGAHQSETLFPDLFEPEIAGQPSRSANREIHFLVGRTVTEQAEGVAGLIQHFLASESVDRIGVLFPAAGALPRTVAALLAEADIPHNDGIAHLAPGPFEDDAWSAWLELQQNPRLRILLRFLRAVPEASRFFEGARVYQIEKVLRSAYCDLLIDDLEVLGEYCARHSHSDHAGQIARGLGTIQFLPRQATLPEFLAQTREIFAGLHWTDRWANVEQASAAWPDRIPGAFSRAIYLRWLAELSTSLLPARDVIGDHPYSRVQLLLYAHAENQPWTHLVFTGLNEGSWPPRPEESGFLDDDEIGALNARIRKLNRRALRQGSQGEGHSVVAGGKAFCLGALERRVLAARQFRNLLESVTGAAGLSANLVDESAPERLANPSEFFTQLYFEARGEALSQAAMGALQKQTETWLQRKSPRPNDSKSGDIQQTAIAYQARRRPEEPFGEYEFALREPATREITISATDWQKAIRTPALIWMKRFLGVEAEDEEFAAWSQATGQWVHRWLRRIAPVNPEDDFAPWPDPATIRARVHEAAMKFRENVSDLLSQFDRSLPEWWVSGWRQAFYIADRLGDRVAQVEGWPYFATEWTLPRRSLPLIAGDESSALSISGRIDLLLARGPKSDDALPAADLWVVDYKTGQRKNLSVKKFLRGDGVQLALYALLLRALGAPHVAASVLTREQNLDRPQLGLADIAAEENVWRAMARMGQSGVFGMRGELRSEFGFQNDYPLATLSVEADWLEEKWARTYPDLVAPEDE